MKSKKIIIVGAGLGGLSSAISLANKGYNVELYEKNEKVGGKLNILEADGFSFDLGPSILTLPKIFEELFEASGKSMSDFINLQEVRPHWRNFFEDGTQVDLSPDIRIMEKELEKFPADEVKNFYRFLEYSRDLYKTCEEGYFSQGIDSLKGIIKYYGITSILKFDIFRSMNNAVCSLIKNKKLQDVLNYFIKYVGSSPYDSPAILNLLPFVQFGYGLWYVKGGMYRLAQALEKLAIELGVKIFFNKEVTRAETSNGIVKTLVLKDGTRITGDLVVSNMEVIPFYEKVLKERQTFLANYRKFEPSCSGLVLHLGVKKIYPGLAHHNFFYSKDSKKHFYTTFKKYELSKDPTIYVVAPCKTDPSQAPDGMEVIKILPHIPHLTDKPYTLSDYNTLREAILNKLERMGLYDLRKHIVFEEMWTPYDIENLYYSNKGSIYGVISDRFKNLGFKCPKKSEKYRNLYFTGGSVNPGGGMPMVVLSGIKVAEMIQRNDRF